MFIKNTSKYPTETVKELVEFGMQHLDFDHSKLVVVVKNNTRGPLRGMAYSQVPSISPFRGKGYNWLVTIGVGDNKHYPCTNMVTKWQRKYLTGWVKESPDGKAIRHGEPTPWGGTYGVHNVRWLIRVSPGRGKIVTEYRFYREEKICHPYGGKKSPFITYNNWQEGLVAVAAHEGQHIVQYSNTKKLFPAKVKLSEVECETVSSMALDDYRTFVASSEQVAA